MGIGKEVTRAMEIGFPTVMYKSSNNLRTVKYTKLFNV